jgi:hypothetical protein
LADGPYKLKATATVQISSGVRWPRNSSVRRTTLTSNRNDVAHTSEKPA